MNWYDQIGFGALVFYLLYFFAGVMLSTYIQPYKAGTKAYLKNVHLVPLLIILWFCSELIEKKQSPDGWD